MVYIGEVWRYVLWNLKDTDDVTDTPLSKIIGNGLRPDIWKQVCTASDDGDEPMVETWYDPIMPT
jgi:hypothetical protein